MTIRASATSSGRDISLNDMSREVAGGGQSNARYSDEGLAGFEAGDAPMMPPENGATTTPALGAELITDNLMTGSPEEAPRSSADTVRTHATFERQFVAPPRDNSILAPRPGGLPYRAAKRAFDVAFSAAIVVAGLVPGALLCAAIALDSPGGPFFRQERVGKGGKHIRIWKFRTMVSDAHEHPERYMTHEQLETWEREQKLDDDPRVTRIGRFLRKYSIDEFPQFLNVLAGNLSVIGPRPITDEELLEFGDGQGEFLSCKPGITGWWQVTDRNDATWENGERQMLELFYVRHASLALDLRIFVRTFKAMFGGTGK